MFPIRVRKIPYIIPPLNPLYKGGRNVHIPIKVGINPLTIPIIIGIINVKIRVHFMEKQERGGGGKKSSAAQVKKKNQEEK